MAEIFVANSSSIQEVISSLRNLNTEFRKKAEDINTEHRNLTTKWEGDASTAFEEHFRNEYPNFESFASAIDEYIRGLEQILSQYERAEEANKNIATS